MKALIVSIAMTCGLLVLTSAHAQAPASAPSGSTGQCNDGTYSTSATKKGACRGHKGVKTWYPPTAATATPASTPAPASAPAMPAPAAMPAKSTMPAPASMPAKTATPSAPSAGGNGQVWVNTSTKVYHCQGDRYYGKTKQGEYMSESDAIAKGDHAARGKRCAS